MNDLDFFRYCTERLNDIYQQLHISSSIKSPVFDETIQQFRHEERNEELFLFLKGVRSISLLNAAIALFDAGHAQEMGILWRCLDETHEDVALFVSGTTDETAKASRTRVLNDFFQEQFQDSSAPILGSNKRDRVPRRNVRSAIASFPENVVNRHDHSSILTIIDEAFSGYVHGAYPHIMELFGGLPGRYHMNGMSGTPRMTEQLGQMQHYVYRTALLTPFIAKRIGSDEIAAAALELREHIERRFPSILGNPVKEIQEMKAKAKRSSEPR